jgi:hypothetical protein
MEWKKTLGDFERVRLPGWRRPEEDRTKTQWSEALMNGVEKAALEILQSPFFFSRLKDVLREIGLEGEEKAGIAVYFGATSRFLSNPLRVFVEQQTEGSAKYIFRSVAQLLPVASSFSVARDERWQEFKKSPSERVIYIAPCDESPASQEDTRFEIEGNRVTRVVQLKSNTRTTEMRDDVESSFACVSARGLPEFKQRSRWLTLKLAAPTPPDNKREPLGQSALAMWHEVQRLLRRQAEIRMHLPDWFELFLEKACQNDRSSRHIPAFFQAAKTMCLLRSFGECGEISRPAGDLEVNFKDLAAAGGLLRGAFKEGAAFPSIKHIHRKIFPAGRETSLLHPLTGKAISYKNEPAPVRWGKFLYP